MKLFEHPEESLECFRALIEHSFDGIFVHRDFRVLDANRQMERMLGFPQGKLLGIDIAQFLTGESLQEVKHYVQNSIPLGHPVDFIRADGSILHTEAFGVCCHFEGKAARIVAVRDQSAMVASRRKIEENLVETAEALAAAVESSDPYTAGHMHRVARFSLEMGRAMDMSAFELQGLYLGAIIHDVGKMAIPGMILNKPGRLTEVEMALVRTHAEQGARIIEDIDFDWPVHDMIIQHHERLDGSGYPQGLPGDDICREARIIAVADVLESMTSHRPYRPALPLDAAVNELRSGKGTRYDSDIIDICFGLMDRQMLDVLPK